jgi:hypothetical protein
MKLLNQKLVDEKSEQRKVQQIRDGELIAKEIDKLRENLGRERVQYSSSIRQMQTHFKEFSETTEVKILSLQNEVNSLEERKRKALEPILKKNLHFLEKENELLLKEKVITEARAEWEQSKNNLENELKQLKLKKINLDSEARKLTQQNLKLSNQTAILEEKNIKLEDYLKIQDKEVEVLDKTRVSLQKTVNELGEKAEKEKASQQKTKDYLINKEEELNSLKIYLVSKEYKLNIMEKKLNKLVDELTIKKQNLDKEVKDLMKKRQEIIRLKKI